MRVIAAIGDDQWRDIIWSAFEEIGVHARLVALKDADLVGTPREGTFIHYGSPD